MPEQLSDISTTQNNGEWTIHSLHPFNGLFSRITWVIQYQRGKTSLDLSEARDDKVLW